MNTSVKIIKKDRIKNGKAYVNLKYKDFILIYKGNDILFYHNAKTGRCLNKVEANINNQKVRYNTFKEIDIPLDFDIVYKVIISKSNKMYVTYIKLLEGVNYSLLIMNGDNDSRVFSLKTQEIDYLRNTYQAKSAYNIVTDEKEIEKYKGL